MKILENITTPKDLRNLSLAELNKLAEELRCFILDSTDQKKGHIESSLTVLELTLALHYVLSTPYDNLFWDVGHQAYVHKVLTDRKKQFYTNRKPGGISGFPNCIESEYDLFTTGHSSTSISAITGMATASRLSGEDRQHVAVIGDGALTGGMAYEALNYLGEAEEDVLIILNDNKGSIDENVGGLQGQNTYQWFFESLGIYYLGEVDGNNLGALIPSLQQALLEPGPRVLHVRTIKTILPSVKNEKSGYSFQDVFTYSLSNLARKDEKIVAITPAMLSGSGLKRFQEIFPQRCFDVGIAEQHAVTMAAGMARAGYKPFCHLYSTFSQRAYDQIIHDVALQNLPVIFMLDRAGLVGEDGPTHHGVFDLAFLNPIPNLVISSPANASELGAIMELAVNTNKPFVIRYPRDGRPVKDKDWNPIKLGTANWLRESGDKIAIASLGHLAEEVADAISLLGEHSTQVSHVDMRFLKPLDQKAINKLLSYKYILTIENGCIKGGFGKTMALALSESGYQGNVKHLGLPDKFIEHGSIKELYHQNGLSAQKIKEEILNLIA